MSRNRDEFQHGPIFASPAQISSYESLYSSALSAQQATTTSQDVVDTTADTTSTTSINDNQVTLSTSVALTNPTNTAANTEPITVSNAGTISDGNLVSQTDSSHATSTSIGFSSLSTDLSTTSTPDLTSSALLTTGTGLTVAASTPAEHTPALSSDPLASSSTSTSTLLPVANGFHNRHHMSGGVIAAAVIIPILVLLLLSGLLLLLFRRRRRQHSHTQEAAAEMTQSQSRHFGPAAVPFGGGFTQSHIRTATNNPTYFTGLETESQHSGGSAGMRSSEEPPPPYLAGAMRSSPARSDLGPPHAAHIYDQRVVPRLQVTNFGPSDLSPFAHDEEYAADKSKRPSNSRKSSGLLQPEMSRQPSARSITSTLYSSDASVMEAEPARVSMAEPHVVRRSGGMERSPFADPEE